MTCPGTTLPATGVTPSSKNAAFASVRFGLMTVRSMKPSSNVAGCPTDRPRRYSVSFEPPATFATLYTTAIVCDAAGASVMRVLSPATPFTETIVMTGEPGLAGHHDRFGERRRRRQHAHHAGARSVADDRRRVQRGERGRRLEGYAVPARPVGGAARDVRRRLHGPDGHQAEPDARESSVPR